MLAGLQDCRLMMQGKHVDSTCATPHIFPRFFALNVQENLALAFMLPPFHNLLLYSMLFEMHRLICRCLPELFMMVPRLDCV
jgi:hypothetical protein